MMQIFGNTNPSQVEQSLKCTLVFRNGVAFFKTQLKLQSKVRVDA